MCWRASTRPTASPASDQPAWRLSCGLPYLSNAASIEPTDGGVQVRRITATGFETLEAPIPALIGCTQALGAPRYPTLKGIMGARSKEVAVLTLADLGLEQPVGGDAAGTRVVDLRQPAGPGRGPRPARRTGRHGTRGRRLPGHARAHLMAGAIWAVGQAAPSGGLTRLSAEVATLARTLAEAAAGTATGIVVAPDPTAAANEMAGYVSRVLAVADPLLSGAASAAIVAERVASLTSDAASDTPDVILTGADPEGRDVAGAVAALLGWPVLANALSVAWGSQGPRVDISVFGGKQFSTSEFSGGRGVITVRPNAVQAAPAARPGAVETVSPTARLDAPHRSRHRKDRRAACRCRRRGCASRRRGRQRDRRARTV